MHLTPKASPLPSFQPTLLAFPDDRQGFPVTSSPTHIALAEPTPIERLDSRGPWLALQSATAIWVFDQDGRHRAEVTLEGRLIPSGDHFSEEISPSGNWLAYRVLRDSQQPTSAELDLLHFPDLTTRKIADLGANAPSPGILSDDLGATWAGWSGLHWSPNGRYLAFVAELERPYADLYVFDLQTGAIRRLTTTQQAIHPLAWTPDGKALLYAERSHCGGNGCRVDMVGIAFLANATLKTLYHPQDSHGEYLVGFIDNEHVILYSSDSLGPVHLRACNLEDLTIESIYVKHFAGVALNPLQHQVIFSLPHGYEQVDPDPLPPGVYRVSRWGEAPARIQDGDWREVLWLPEQKMFLIGGSLSEGTLVIDAEEQVYRFPQENWWVHRADISPDGAYIAFPQDGQYMHESSGLRLYRLTGERVGGATDSPMQGFSWRPDGQGYFSISLGEVYACDQIERCPAPHSLSIHIGSISGYGLGWIFNRQ
ncbi:MAG: hypothetical protein PHQ40_16140 [Anaerolineaceae bacterium]|nr:hypothetical protein [Anaerolineaceae bacterium]